jgi:hypothetical protein
LYNAIKTTATATIAEQEQRPQHHHHQEQQNKNKNKENHNKLHPHGTHFSYCSENAHTYELWGTIAVVGTLADHPLANSIAA